VKRTRGSSERAARRCAPAGEGSGIDELTPQELQVALTVVGGVSNREAAAQRFLSTKTIETHLHPA
jgi:DNA-binding NarL/FixJ family response regulator